MRSMLLALTVAVSTSLDEKTSDSPFSQRRYYITFMRMPTYDLADWKHLLSGIHDDGGNT